MAKEESAGTLPVDKYDQEHGHPESTPPVPPQSDAERWGTDQNPLRETETPFKNLKQVGG